MKCSTQKCATSSRSSIPPVTRCRYQWNAREEILLMSDFQDREQDDGDRAGQEQRAAETDGERPEESPLAAVPDPEVDERDTYAVQRMKDDGPEQGDLEQLEERAAKAHERRVEGGRA